MKRRWIVRSFFIALLLLCVGGWVGSYWYGFGIAYSGNDDWIAAFYPGTLYLMWGDGTHASKTVNGWSVFAGIANPTSFVFWPKHNEYHFLGFYVRNRPILRWAGIPLYFPTAISAALLLFVWRKTRPKVKGKAFPVELNKSAEEQMGEAKYAGVILAQNCKLGFSVPRT